MPCSRCPTPLFAHEQPLGLCRTHGLAGTTLHDGALVPKQDGTTEVEPWYRRDSLNTLRDLGSLLPPLPARDSVRVHHRVLQPTEDELRAFVAGRQTLTPAMRASSPLRLVTD